MSPSIVVLSGRGQSVLKALSLGGLETAGSRSNDITRQLGSTPATAYIVEKTLATVLSTQNQSQALVCT